VKVLVTGHRGYIGVHLVDVLKAAGHEVTGCDVRLFEGCEWEPFTQADHDLHKDVRELEPQEVAGHDCVMHLAAISNDPMGDINPDLTASVNRDASIRLAQIAKETGVPRYLFASSCSVYGKRDGLIDESGDLNPLTIYAKSKIDTEAAVGEMASDDFTPAYLRNATAYGHSPMLRIDIVANNLLARALGTGAIAMISDGTPWRPLIHCRDIARAFCAFMEAPQAAIHNQAINVGGNQENYQVKQVADEVQRLVPEASITFAQDSRDDDPRSYRVSFDRLAQALPDFRLSYTLATGLEELHARMIEHGFDQSDLEGDQFVRLRTLGQRLGRLAQTA
jgi:nucleoside-diphosphate-sugar epimerase